MGALCFFRFEEVGVLLSFVAIVVGDDVATRLGEVGVCILMFVVVFVHKLDEEVGVGKEVPPSLDEEAAALLFEEEVEVVGGALEGSCAGVGAHEGEGLGALDEEVLDAEVEVAAEDVDVFEEGEVFVFGKEGVPVGVEVGEEEKNVEEKNALHRCEPVEKFL